MPTCSQHPPDLRAVTDLLLHPFRCWNLWVITLCVLNTGGMSYNLHVMFWLGPVALGTSKVGGKGGACQYVHQEHQVVGPNAMGIFTRCPSRWAMHFHATQIFPFDDLVKYALRPPPIPLRAKKVNATSPFLTPTHKQRGGGGIFFHARYQGQVHQARQNGVYRKDGAVVFRERARGKLACAGGGGSWEPREGGGGSGNGALVTEPMVKSQFFDILAISSLKSGTNSCQSLRGKRGAQAGPRG